MKNILITVVCLVALSTCVDTGVVEGMDDSYGHFRFATKPFWNESFTVVNENTWGTPIGDISIGVSGESVSSWGGGGIQPRSGNSLGKDIGDLVKWAFSFTGKRVVHQEYRPEPTSGQMAYDNAKSKGLSEEECVKEQEKSDGLANAGLTAKTHFPYAIGGVLRKHNFDRSERMSKEVLEAIAYMRDKEPLLLNGFYGLIDTSPEILRESWCDSGAIIEGARMVNDGITDVKEHLIRNSIGHEITRPVTPTKFDKAYTFMKDNKIPFTSVPGKFGEYANIRYAAEVNSETYDQRTVDPNPFGSTYTWNDMPNLNISQKDTPSFNFSRTEHTSVGYTNTELLNYFNQEDVDANVIANNFLEDISAFHKSFVETYKQSRDFNAAMCQLYIEGVKHLNISNKAKSAIRGLLQANAQINGVGDTATDLLVLPLETSEKIFKAYVQSRAETLIFFMKIKAEEDREYGLEYFLKSKTMPKEEFEEYVAKDIERRSDILGTAAEMTDVIWENGIDGNINLLLENGVRELVTAAFLSQTPTFVGGTSGIKFDFTSGTAVAKAVKTASGGTPSLQGTIVTSIVKEQAKKFGFTAVKNKDAKMLLKAFDTVRVSGVATSKTKDEDGKTKS